MCVFVAICNAYLSYKVNKPIKSNTFIIRTHSISFEMPYSIPKTKFSIPRNSNIINLNSLSKLP